MDIKISNLAPLKGRSGKYSLGTRGRCKSGMIQDQAPPPQQQLVPQHLPEDPEMSEHLQHCWECSIEPTILHSPSGIPPLDPCMENTAPSQGLWSPLVLLGKLPHTPNKAARWVDEMLIITDALASHRPRGPSAPPSEEGRTPSKGSAVVKKYVESRE